MSDKVRHQPSLFETPPIVGVTEKKFYALLS